jgi:phosphate transport system protein
MIETSIESFKTKDTKLARSLRLEDDQVDKIYMDYNKQLAAGRSKPTSLKCALTSLLVLRYLERIADHACYIADSVIYITTATKV